MTRDEVIVLANELLAAEPKQRHILAFAAAIEARVRGEQYVNPELFHEAEEYGAVSLCLDDRKVDSHDASGKKYSLWGRVEQYARSQVAPLMKYDPVTGDENPFPSEAKQYRKWHGPVAFLYNPYTGEKRAASDIGTDVFGHLIINY